MGSPGGRGDACAEGLIIAVIGGGMLIGLMVENVRIQGRLRSFPAVRRVLGPCFSTGNAARRANPARPRKYATFDDSRLRKRPNNCPQRSGGEGREVANPLVCTLAQEITIDLHLGNKW